MKFKIKREILSNALKNVNEIINPNNMNPMLSGVLIKAENNSIQLIGTDSANYQQIIDNINVEKNGQILVKAKVLYNIVSSLKEDEIELNQIEDNILHIQTQTFSSDINLLDSFSFPNMSFVIDGWEKITLNIDTIFNIYSKIRPFVTQQNSSQFSIMHGILFNPIDEKTMESVASDGIRIAYHKFDYQGKGIKFVVDPIVIEFANSILTTTKNKTIDFYIKDRKCALHINNTTIIFNLYENNYQNIISPLFTDQKYSFTVKLNDLYTAIIRGNEFVVGEKNPAVNIKIENNKLIIKFISNEVGSSFEELPIIKTNIQNFDLKINQKKLAELISTIDSETITFNFNGPLTPIVISSENPYFINLILPLRNI